MVLDLGFPHKYLVPTVLDHSFHLIARILIDRYHHFALALEIWPQILGFLRYHTLSWFMVLATALASILLFTILIHLQSCTWEPSSKCEENWFY